jgi:tetratricopeptide (TPR) repeat protein
LSKNRKPHRTATSPDRTHDAVTDIKGTFEDALRQHRAGQPIEAERLFRMVLAAEPRHADSLYFLGLIAYQSGRYDIAIERIGQAIPIKQGVPFYHYTLGNALRAQGRVAEAAAQFEHALALKPDYVEAHNNLGLILNEQGKRDEAVAHYERALAINPDSANVHANLGLVLAAQGRIVDAIAHYQRALALDPNHANAHYSLGLALAAQGRIADAIAHYQRVLALNPRHTYAHNNLAAALIAQGRIAEAIPHYECVAALKPDDADAHSNLGTALAETGRATEAMAHLERALALNPGHADAHNSLGNMFKDEGKFDEAMTHYGLAIAIRPDFGEAHLNRSEIKSFRAGDADLTMLETLAGRNDLSENTALRIHFALAKALEDTGDFIRAFEHLRQGNTLKRRQIDYRERMVLSLFQRVSTVFDRSLMSRFEGKGDPSPVPVFVLGMPRSGSSLIEQILASHPQIHGAGELTDFEEAAGSVFRTGGRTVEYPECVPLMDDSAPRRIGQSYLGRLPAVADGKIRIVDKLPGNFVNIGLIRLALPDARIIHTMRHPIDTCVSCYSKLFTIGHHYTYDLAELGRFYRAYSELMTHWRRVLPPGAMLDVSYEDVVDDLEGQARRMIDYCGLPWDDRCIDFHRTSRTVKTASSVQVRKPLFRSSLQRWRKYESGIAPLLDELGTLLL